jgi:hypothetical protein
MNKKIVLALVLAASVAACKKTEDAASVSHDAVTSTAASPAADATAADAAASPTDATAPSAAADTTTVTATAPKSHVAKPAAQSSGAENQPLGVTAPDLAYAFNYSVQAPARDVPHLVRQHEAECTMAGPTTCQVVGAQSTAIGRDDVSGRLELRATPKWIAAFRDRVEDDVKALGGKITAADTGTEDLSRSLVDTEAGIRAKVALRDRLEVLLKTHKGKLDDLVDLEQQVAQVQGDIDQAQSELAVMKTRVQTQKLVIEYSSLTALAPDSAFRPLGQAAHRFTGHVMTGVAILVDAVSILLPFGLVIGGGYLIFRRRKPRPVRAHVATD